MQPLQVQFLFDIGSPNAYLCHKVLKDIEWRTGAGFDYVPILLGGLFKLSNNRSPFETTAGIPNKQAYDRLEMQRFITKHRLVRFKPNPHFPVNTLSVMRHVVAAQVLGCGPQAIDALFSAMWEQAIPLGEPGALSAVLSEAGLDAPALTAKTQESNIKERLLQNSQSAYQRGAFGAPTFFVGDELFFGKDRLADVEAEIARVSAAG